MGANARQTAAGKATVSSRAPWPRPVPLWAVVGALVCALGATAAAGALVYQHFSGDPLPGCGPQSACATIDNHPFGRIDFPPALASAAGMPKWPVSFLGLAFFLSLSAGLAAAGRRLPRTLVWAIRLGAAVSAVYLVVIVADQTFCKYCIASHALNFGVLAFLEVGMRTFRTVRTGGEPVVSRLRAVPMLVAGVFTLSTASLGLAEREKVGERTARQEAKLAEDTKALAEKVAKDRAAAEKAGASEPDPFGPGGFTGRWRSGPEAAQVRLVVFSSYQCVSCRRIEQEAFALMDKHPGKISLTAKHFPLSTDCNKHVVGESPHPNSCWAARAAETAGMLKGQEGFWQMHKWLFDRGGAFNDAELIAGLKQLGYDDKTFTTIMMSDAPLRLVQQDADQAAMLGLNQTPMVFINGVEFRGWEPAQALQRAVESILAQNPPALTAAADRPVLAKDKLIGDWREERVRPIPGAPAGRFLGAADAPVVIDLFGDYTNPNTVEADKFIRSWIATKPIKYTYRHFPGNPACNPTLKKVFFEHGCLAARAVEAAFKVGTPEQAHAYHAWLLANSTNLKNDDAVHVAGAQSVGIDGEAFHTALKDPASQAAVAASTAIAQQIGVDRIPAVFVNGKLVKVWQRDGDLVLERVIDTAAKEAK